MQGEAAPVKNLESLMSEEMNNCGNLVTPVTDEDSQSSLTEVESKPDISLSGNLNVSDYLQHIPPSQKVVQDMSDWTERQRETTRTKLVMWLAKLLGSSLMVTFILIGVAMFNPKVDGELIKDLAPQLITAQVTLLGVAFGFYFSNKED